MKRIFSLYRPVFSAGIMLVLVAVVALSSATRQPCLRACTGPWHTYKAGLMTQSEQQEVSVTKAAESAEDPVAETEASPAPCDPHEEMLPVALSLTVQKHHFRSPPFLQ
jgi:hypothetical protein